MQDLTIATAIFRIILAALCGGVIGANRLLYGRAAGIRTHMIVCLGSALTIITGFFAFSEFSLATDPLRIGAQVMSGIGFLGVGTIIVTGRRDVTGLTTAAGLWTTASIGLAVGAGYYIIAIAATVITFIVILLVRKAETSFKNNQHEYYIYVEVANLENASMLIESVSYLNEVLKVDITPPRSAITGNVGVEFNIGASSSQFKTEFTDLLKETGYALIVLDSIR